MEIQSVECLSLIGWHLATRPAWLFYCQWKVDFSKGSDISYSRVYAEPIKHFSSVFYCLNLKWHIPFKRPVLTGTVGDVATYIIAIKFPSMLPYFKLPFRQALNCTHCSPCCSMHSTHVCNSNLPKRGEGRAFCSFIAGSGSGSSRLQGLLNSTMFVPPIFGQVSI